MKYIIYHNNCYDGFTAAFVFNYLGRSFPNEELVFIPCNHGEPFPERDYNKEVDECYILDFSFKRDVILANKDRFKFFLILDHHATAQKDLEGLDCAIFDMNRSGALITLDYLMNTRNYEVMNLQILEKLITYVKRVSDRDLFQFKLPLTSETYFVQSAHDMTFENWMKIMLMSDEVIQAKGKLIQQYERVFIGKRLEEIYFVHLTDGENNYTIPCVNLSPEFGTNACQAILNKYPEYNYACYHWYGLAKKVWGIRSRAGFDCSKIAKHYGGGGHPQASGWRENI